jgi:hypothetical protein
MTVAELLRVIHECRVVDAENTEILLDKGGRLTFVDADIRYELSNATLTLFVGEKLEDSDYSRYAG